jgi:hypothetical protein
MDATTISGSNHWRALNMLRVMLILVLGLSVALPTAGADSPTGKNNTGTSKTTGSTTKKKESTTKAKGSTTKTTGTKTKTTKTKTTGSTTKTTAKETGGSTSGRTITSVQFNKKILVGFNVGKTHFKVAKSTKGKQYVKKGNKVAVKAKGGVAIAVSPEK